MKTGCTTLIMSSDNFITRWMVNHDWKIKIQYSNDARILTTLGTYPKFLSQCLRWSRTTWRSNAVSLFRDGTVWRTQPWSVYATYLSSFFNFALFYDAALFYTLWLAREHTVIQNIGLESALKYLGIWIFCSKLVKPFPHFWRNPGDLVYLPGYIFFGYYHSFIKLYALLTFGVTTWGTRPGVDGKSEDLEAKPPHSVDKGILTELSEWDFITEFSGWDVFSQAYVITYIWAFGAQRIYTGSLDWPALCHFLFGAFRVMCLHKPRRGQETSLHVQNSYLRWEYWWRSFLGIFKWDIFSTTLMVTAMGAIAQEVIDWFKAKQFDPDLDYYITNLAEIFFVVCLSRRHRILEEFFRLRNLCSLWIHWSQLWVYWWRTLRLLQGEESEIAKNRALRWRFK